MTKLETKIAKLLAQAEGTPYPEEAEVFMKKAEELMLKHGIERANLDAKQPSQKREEIVQERFTIRNGHGYAAAMAAICHGLAPSFSVTSLQTILHDSGRVIWFIGYKSDVERAKQLALSLVEQSRTQALHWWRTEGLPTHPYHSANDAYLARREFIFAFASGVRSRLEETRNRVVEEAEAGTALVLVDRAKVVKNWVEENIETRKGRRTTRRVGSGAARDAGRQAGRDAVSPKMPSAKKALK